MLIKCEKEEEIMRQFAVAIINHTRECPICHQNLNSIDSHDIKKFCLVLFIYFLLDAMHEDQEKFRKEMDFEWPEENSSV